MELEKLFKELHACPEVGFGLHQTSAIVRRELDRMGVPYTIHAVTGIVGRIDAGHDDWVLLRADMDGLPIAEDSGLDYASANGCMHACGHDAHTTMLLGAAEELLKRKGELKHNILLVFQPAEEGMSGAKRMIEDGAIKGFNIKAAFAIHIASGREVGTMVLREGVITPVGAKFEIEISGSGGHAGKMLDTENPGNMGAEIVCVVKNLFDVNRVRAHISSFHFGTTGQPGIIADTCLLEGGVRAFTADETRS